MFRSAQEEMRAMIEADKPRLWRSLEEVRDRAKDVQEKVAALASRARRELEEVRAVVEVASCPFSFLISPVIMGAGS